MGAKNGLNEPGQPDTNSGIIIPADWGLTGWTPERFKAFNDARRKLHKLMQRWDQILLGKGAIVGKANFEEGTESRQRQSEKACALDLDV